MDPSMRDDLDSPVHDAQQQPTDTHVTVATSAQAVPYVTPIAISSPRADTTLAQLELSTVSRPVQGVSIQPHGAPRTIPHIASVPRRPSGIKKKVAKTKKTLKAKGNGGRGNGFTQVETENFLELLQEHLPLGRGEREHVSKKHAERYPSHGRTIDSLKRKFASLHRKRIPTGDPLMPPQVKQAKQIRYQVTDRADKGDAEESIGAFEGAFVLSESDDADESDFVEDNDGDTEQQIDSLNGSNVSMLAPPNTPANGQSPKPRRLVQKRFVRGIEKTTSGNEDLFALYKMQLIQDQSRREDEREKRELEREEQKERREEERMRREEDRKEERERREEERIRRAEERLEERARQEYNNKKHDQMMQALILSFTRSSQS